MNNLIRRIKCMLGYHELQEFLFSRDPEIWELRCIHCGHSPTWER